MFHISHKNYDGFLKTNYGRGKIIEWEEWYNYKKKF